MFLFNLHHLNAFAHSFSSFSSSEMVFNPFEDNTKFVDLLNSQQNVVFGSQGSVSVSASQDPFVGSQQEPIHCDKLPAERRERKTWSPSEDIVLISSWLNTSKDPVVGNEQKSMAFWKRIAAYYLKKISR